MRWSHLITDSVKPSDFVAVRLGKPLTNDIPSLLSNELANKYQKTLDFSAAMKTEKGLVVVAGEHDFTFESHCKPDIDESWTFTKLLQSCMQDNLEGRIVLVCPSSVSGAMVVGVSKAFALEYPDITITRVYHDSSKTLTLLAVTTLLQATSKVPTVETDVEVRGCDRSKLTLHVPRAIVEYQPCGQLDQQQPDIQSTLHENGTYLITGGTGGVGMAFVNWLLTACNIAPSSLHVLCRNAESSAARALRSQMVNLIEVDVSDCNAVQSNAALSSLTTVDGIFHLAGVLDDGLVASMTKESIAKVAGPKAVAISSLLQKAQQSQWDVDFLLNFSSTSSLLGYPGQSNYCAANAVLDHMATWGLGSTNELSNVRVLTINWGPWGEAGMAAKGTKAYTQAMKDGDFPLSNLNAFAELNHSLSQLFRSPSTNQEFMVCDVDWSRSQWKTLPLVGHCVSESVDIDSSDDEVDLQTDKIDSDDSAIDVGINDEIETLMRSMVPSWSLFETLPAVGLDSLDIVQMRNAIVKELKLSVSLSVFNAPNRTLGELLSILRLTKQTQKLQK